MRLIDADDVDNHIVGSVNLIGCPTINAIPIPEDATNGDVIKAVFPNGKIIKTEDGDCGYEIYLDDTYSFCSWFDDLWWNAKYKGVE